MVEILRGIDIRGAEGQVSQPWRSGEKFPEYEITELTSLKQDEG